MQATNASYYNTHYLYIGNSLKFTIHQESNFFVIKDTVAAAILLMLVKDALDRCVTCVMNTAIITMPTKTKANKKKQ